VPADGDSQQGAAMIKMLERLVLCYATEELLGEHKG
jgi:hypothetical protein